MKIITFSLIWFLGTLGQQAQTNQVMSDPKGFEIVVEEPIQHFDLAITYDVDMVTAVCEEKLAVAAQGWDIAIRCEPIEDPAILAWTGSGDGDHRTIPIDVVVDPYRHAPYPDSNYGYVLDATIHHEMCHVKLLRLNNYVGHGKLFQECNEEYGVGHI